MPHGVERDFRWGSRRGRIRRKGGRKVSGWQRVAEAGRRGCQRRQFLLGLGARDRERAAAELPYHGAALLGGCARGDRGVQRRVDWGREADRWAAGQRQPAARSDRGRRLPGHRARGRRQPRRGRRAAARGGTRGLGRHPPRVRLRLHPRHRRATARREVPLPAGQRELIPHLRAGSPRRAGRAVRASQQAGHALHTGRPRSARSRNPVHEPIRLYMAECWRTVQK